MVAFKGMLVTPAKRAGISVPDDLDCFNSADYPHWIVFCEIQLGAAMPTPTAHWDNAKIIASISNDDITKIIMTELIDLGIQIGYPIP